jgi:hypothetical protein
LIQAMQATRAWRVATRTWRVRDRLLRLPLLRWLTPSRQFRLDDR